MIITRNEQKCETKQERKTRQKGDKSTRTGGKNEKDRKSGMAMQTTEAKQGLTNLLQKHPRPNIPTHGEAPKLRNDTTRPGPTRRNEPAGVNPSRGPRTRLGTAVTSARNPAATTQQNINSHGHALRQRSLRLHGGGAGAHPTAVAPSRDTSVEFGGGVARATTLSPRGRACANTLNQTRDNQIRESENPETQRNVRTQRQKKIKQKNTRAHIKIATLNMKGRASNECGTGQT